jgi:hypothetical protein
MLTTQDEKKSFRVYGADKKEFLEAAINFKKAQSGFLTNYEEPEFQNLAKGLGDLAEGLPILSKQLDRIEHRVGG